MLFWFVQYGRFLLISVEKNKMSFWFVQYGVSILNIVHLLNVCYMGFSRITKYILKSHTLFPQPFISKRNSAV